MIGDDFMNRAGEFIRNMTGEAAYMSFRPASLPPEPPLELDADLIRLLIDANCELARLNTAAAMIPSTDLFVSMYVRKEALMTSQIEGTQCTLDDILDPDADSNVNLDVSDVVNYINAAQFALQRLKSLPLCNRLLRETHAQLMTGVRGQEKNPGEFRRSQNWIGPAGSTLKNARYIPPNVEDMTSAMSELEKYINESQEYDPLVQAALIHYQFETIHPFLDGNGRIGRLLILLYLIQQNLLGQPVLYVSYFLKKNQIKGDKIVYYRHKTGQSITIKLEPCMKDIINRYLTDSRDYVFPIIKSSDKDKAYAEYQKMLNRYNKKVKKLAQKAGVQNRLTSYTPRHTWASLAYSNCIDLHVISKGLGHTNPQTTLTYIRQIDDNRLEEANHSIVTRVVSGT